MSVEAKGVGETAGQFRVPQVPRWLGFLATCMGMFMAILDIQLVVTALPVIESALKIGADQMSWVQTSYLIAEVIAIPLTGLLMRVFSMRWLFTGSLIVFTLASIGCASSVGLYDLLLWRVLQGFAGGVLIPMVFASIFLLFPVGIQQTIATTLGGFLAVLVPSLGPIAGGWLTEHYSWHWLFLINVVPGIVAVVIGFLCLPRGKFQLGLLGHLDWLSLVLMGIGLALLLVGLKEAPTRGWLSLPVVGCFAITIVFSWIIWRRPNPAIMFHLFEDRALAYGCAFSFLLGFSLFGMVYLMPVFLAFVRGHGPLEIGIITLINGISQLVAAPIAVQVDRHFDARWLTGIGFAVFAVGLFMSTHQTVDTDYNEMFWPQVVRGLAIAFCILPPIRLALGFIPLDKIGDASGLFNVSRNIGGAIGIALIDTVIFSRAPEFTDQIMIALKTDPAAAAKMLGLPIADLPSPDDSSGLMGIMDSIQGASLSMAINECWFLLGAVCLLAFPVLWMLGPIRNAIPVTKLAREARDKELDSTK
jgi:MFS transporter, DHA2 family, multidrug resistance protein